MHHVLTLTRLERFSQEERLLIEQALDYSTACHAPQRRVSGEPFITHPVAVAQSLIDDFGADADTVAAGLLHDAVEDTPATLDDVESRFGKTIRFLVDGATDVGKGDGAAHIPDVEERSQQSHMKVDRYAQSDPRVYLVKLADRWHNIKHCAALRPKNQLRMAMEALSYHVVIARRLGLVSQADAIERAACEVLARNNTIV